MSKSIFISVVHEDSKWINNIKTWANNGQLGDVVITHEIEDKRAEGYNAIREHISRKIKGAAVLMVLVGDTTHNHDWIRAEVELANSFHIKICVVRLPQTKGSKPDILKNYKELAFEPNTIKNDLGL